MSLALKKVWAKGNGWKPSIGSETGLLFPTGKGDRGVDVEVFGILTWEREKLSVHTTLGGAALQVVDSEEVSAERHTRAAVFWGMIAEYSIRQGFRVGIEYFLEKVETEPFVNQVMVGLRWDAFWGIRFDVAGLAGLNEQSDDFGATLGLTYAWGEEKQEGAE